MFTYISHDHKINIALTPESQIVEFYKNLKLYNPEKSPAVFPLSEVCDFGYIIRVTL